MVEALHQSLIEAGKNKQKALSFLLFLSFLIVVVQMFLSGNAEIQVLNTQIKLSRDKAASVYFVLYSVYFFRFVAITNYEKIIFYNLFKELKKDEKQKTAWHYVHPSAINYLLYEWHIKKGRTQRINLAFIKAFSVVIVCFPVVYTLSNLSFNHFGEIPFLLLILLSLSFYSLATVNLVSSISEIREMNNEIFE